MGLLFVPINSCIPSLVWSAYFFDSLNTREEEADDEENWNDEEGEESDSKEDDPLVCDEPASGSGKREPQQEATHASSKTPIQQNQEQEKSLTIEEAKHKTKVPVESLVSEKNASKEQAAETAKPTPLAENKQEPVDPKTPATVEPESSAKRIFVCMYACIYLQKELSWRCRVLHFLFYAQVFIR